MVGSGSVSFFCYLRSDEKPKEMNEDVEEMRKWKNEKHILDVLKFRWCVRMPRRAGCEQSKAQMADGTREI